MREVLEGRTDVTFRDMRFPTDVRFTESLLALHGEGLRPSAFFCAHDGLGLTVVSELLRLGYRIPEDASVVAFGDFSAATQITPRLTTVRTNGQQMGAACVRILDERIHGRLPAEYPLRVMITARMVERESSGPFRHPAPALRGMAGATQERQLAAG
jgi:LacI family transcriptional regulator